MTSHELWESMSRVLCTEYKGISVIGDKVPIMQECIDLIQASPNGASVMPIVTHAMIGGLNDIISPHLSVGMMYGIAYLLLVQAESAETLAVDELTKLYKMEIPNV